jgi:uncharacterized membrane protein YqaE (UPF0057 family)
MSKVIRHTFTSRASYANYARFEFAPRYSAIVCSSFFTGDHKALGLQPGEALFSDDLEALQREAIGWERNRIEAALVPTDLDPEERAALNAPEQVWLVRAAPGFPENLLDQVFSFCTDCPALDTPINEVEAMALAQLCDQPEHPLMFLDRLDPGDAAFLDEVAAPRTKKRAGRQRRRACAPAAAGNAPARQARRATPRNGLPLTQQPERPFMRLIIALFLPWLTFFTIGRPISGILCLVLQITVIGWLPATIWAVYSLSQYKTDKKIEKALGQKGA